VACSTHDGFVDASRSSGCRRRVFGCGDTPAMWKTSATDAPHGRTNAVYASTDATNEVPDAPTAATDAINAQAHRPTAPTDRLIVRADAMSGRTVTPTDRVGTVNALANRVHDQLASVYDAPEKLFTQSTAATLCSAGLSSAPSTVTEVSDSVYTFSARVNARSSTVSTFFPTDHSLPDAVEVFPTESFPHRSRQTRTRRRCMRCRTSCMHYRSAFTRLRTR